MVSVLPVSAAPSRNDANELPPPLASVVAPGTRRFQEAEAGPAADVLLTEAIGLLPVEGEAGLDRVRAPADREVVLDREPRLLGPVVGRSAPRRKLGEGDDAEVLVAIDRIRNADPLVSPVLIDVGRERILVERVHADAQVIHHARADDPVPAAAVKVAVEARRLKRVERRGKSGRAGLDPGTASFVVRLKRYDRRCALLSA